MAARTQKQDEAPKVPAAARAEYDAITALTDAFCREHLTDEYADLTLF